MLPLARTAHTPHPPAAREVQVRHHNGQFACACLTSRGRFVARTRPQSSACLHFTELRPEPFSKSLITEDRLRFCGLSRAKASYLHDLARRKAEGAIDLEDMAGIDDAAALAALTAVRGVGLWSAQIFLVHQLKRAGLLPASDMGIRRAVQRARQLDYLVSRLAEG